MQTYSSINLTTNKWNAGSLSTDYQTDYTYASYFWNFGDNETATGIYQSHVYDTSYNPYLLQLIVTNTQNCSDTATDSVVVISDNLFAFPTSFTPNNDGLNENFEFSGYQYVKTIHTEVINRWGQKMLIQDGKPNFSSLPEGVYVYFIKIEDIYGKSHKLKGTFRVLR